MALSALAQRQDLGIAVSALDPRGQKHQFHGIGHRRLRKRVFFLGGGRKGKLPASPFGFNLEIKLAVTPLYLDVRNERLGTISQGSGMHPGEVTDVHEILDHARRTGFPVVATEEERAVLRKLELGKIHDRAARLVEANEDQPISLTQ
jgi:hypothetical protein